MNAQRVLLALTSPIALLAAVAAGPAAAAAPGCEATVHAEVSHIERKELVSTYTYTVEVTTLEPCATVRFALYTTERISKTKVKVFVTPSEVRLRDGSISKILNYDMPNGRKMVRWEVKVTGCERFEP
jgi:predicted thioesterase